jgi:catechol 2,3-dioxygenase-like lactoylglutathione lyase family enzyme
VSQKEVIEIYSGQQNHRFNHVHLFAADVNKTAQWFADNFGALLARREVPKPAEPCRTWATAVRVDNVTINIFAKPDTTPAPSWWSGPPLTDLQPTKGRAIDHFAFSYRKLEPVYERLRKAGAQIVEPMALREEDKLKSFFVLSPDNALVEIVEAKPIPEGIWEK